MKQLLVTTCAVVALCGTAFAQAPADKGKNAPAAKSDTSAQPAQPSGSQATQPSAQAPADKSGASADQGAMKPNGSTAQKAAGDKEQAPSGKTAAAQGSEQVSFYNVKPDDVQASNLIGATVYNANDESIGDIEDIIIDEQNELRAVVIGVGGFLGVGEHDVAVEMSALEIMDQTDSDEVRIVLNTTKADLENAPAVKLDQESSQQAASEGSGEMTGSAETSGAGSDGASESGSMKQPEDAAKADEGMDGSKSGVNKSGTK